MPQNTPLPLIDFITQVRNTYIVLYEEPLSDAGNAEAARVLPEGKDVYEDFDSFEPGALILEFKCEGDKIVPHPMYWTDDPVERRGKFQYVFKQPHKNSRTPYIFEHTTKKNGELYPTGAFEILEEGLQALRRAQKDIGKPMQLAKFITDYGNHIKG